LSNLKSKGVLPNFQFGVLIGIAENDTSMFTLNGHKADLYGRPGFDMIGHKISGSFHWSLRLVKCKIGDIWYLPKGLQALTDTGTTYMLMPKGNIM
jgi:hypothetical protein